MRLMYDTSPKIKWNFGVETFQICFAILLVKSGTKKDLAIKVWKDSRSAGEKARESGLFQNFVCVVALSSSSPAVQNSRRLVGFLFWRQNL